MRFRRVEVLHAIPSGIFLCIVFANALWMMGPKELSVRDVAFATGHGLLAIFFGVVIAFVLAHHGRIWPWMFAG